MSIVKKAAVLVSIGMASTGVLATQADARNGYNEPIVGVAGLGVGAGAAIFNTAGAKQVEQVGWYGYDERSDYAPHYYVRPRRYIRVYPQPYSENYVIARPLHRWHRGWMEHDRRWRRDDRRRWQNNDDGWDD